ncbi:MAG: glycosyltransferase family 4 protein [Phycisphaerae bacterium]|nr:glycosyltransferase family 4 protein [Phycisphaerae bacterium]
MIEKSDSNFGKICILSSAHEFSDVRVFQKEAKTLANAGYEVVYIARAIEKEIVLDGIKLIPLPEPKNRLERMTKTVFRLFKLALREKADVYHFHDPELMTAGIMLKLMGKKVIYDAHEDVSKDIFAKKWAGNLFTKKSISLFINLFERTACLFFDRIITVTPGIAKRYPANKTIVLRNFPILTMIDGACLSDPIDKQKPAIVYAGGLNSVRGIAEIIQAMDIIKDKAELWLLGKWVSEEFRQKCEKLPGWQHTRYFGLVPMEEMYNYMSYADVGIVPFLPRPHNLHSLPNKPFEYMACSLPVVMSNIQFWQEMFDGCAVFCNSEDPSDIAEKIDSLLSSPDDAKKLAEIGKKRVLEKYNWKSESKKLIQLYHGLLND